MGNQYFTINFQYLIIEALLTLCLKIFNINTGLNSYSVYQDKVLSTRGLQL